MCSVVTTLWWIWKWRNYRNFGRDRDIPLDVSSFLRQRVEATWRALTDDVLSGLGSSQHQQQIYINGKFPPIGSYALNTDGAARGNPGLAGGGGIIRDCQGRMQHAFAVNLGSCSAFRAEMKAIEAGLELASRMCIRALMIQMDNMACIQLLQSLDPYGGECVHIVHNCREIIKNNDWEVSFFHCYREGNKAANWLANQGVVQTTKYQTFQVPPLELGRILHEDLSGVSWTRIISS